VQACTLAVVLPTWAQQGQGHDGQARISHKRARRIHGGRADQEVIQIHALHGRRDEGQGLLAENTLAGSRLNTISAISRASIRVVTKHQMEDTGSLDINDVFKYEASTEGSASYTP